LSCDLQDGRKPMPCSRCNGEQVVSGGIPSVRLCRQCGRQEVELDGEWVALPLCPKCRKPLGLVTGVLPLTVSHVECGQHFYFNAGEGVLYARGNPFPIGTPPACPACGKYLSRFEDLPPRGRCDTCGASYITDPLMRIEPCKRCGGTVEVIRGVMPPTGACTGCARKVTLAKAGKRVKPPRG